MNTKRERSAFITRESYKRGQKETSKSKLSHGLPSWILKAKLKPIDRDSFVPLSSILKLEVPNR